MEFLRHYSEKNEERKEKPPHRCYLSVFAFRISWLTSRTPVLVSPTEVFAVLLNPLRLLPKMCLKSAHIPMIPSLNIHDVI
jgi:hypothetical protein